MLVLLATLVFWMPVARRSQPVSTRPTRDSLSELVREADSDMRAGRFTRASAKYKQALMIDPKSPGVKDKLNQASDRLIDRATALIAKGDEQGAAELAAAVAAQNPTNTKAQAILDKAEGNPQESNWEPHDLNDPNSTPRSVLPPTMADYRITQSGWLRKPERAGQTYRPKIASVAKEIDRVLLTVAKFKQTSQTVQLSQLEKDIFPVDAKDEKVNGHGAYFGLYDEANPTVYPILATLTWTRGNWFFAVEIIPRINRQTRTDPSPEYKKGIALDIARKLGY